MPSVLPALRHRPSPSPWKRGDVLVLFGELFSRGYGNGLVEEAERLGMTIIRSTVGRREKDGVLRPLTAEEVAALPSPLINIPLEAGFDLEPGDHGHAPVDFLKDLKLTEWETGRIEESALQSSRRRAVDRFRGNVTEFMRQLAPLIPSGADVLFAHLMAGGVPRTKVVMPLFNRMVKGTGDRYLPSETFWKSEIGRFCAMNFLEVTAETFRHLVELSAPLRERIQQGGGRTSYVAYGYHGTEILLDDAYRWQTYTPYLQGEAKMALEEAARTAHQNGLAACVYNCPEILTNSSSIFQGVELALYPLLQAFQRDAPDVPLTRRLTEETARHLTDGQAGLERIRSVVAAYFSDPEIQAHCLFDKWPQHTSRRQLEIMLKASDELTDLHADPKKMLTAVLSEAVFEACGRLMIHDSWQPRQPVAWIGHDVVVRTLADT